jgi:hypothetical protein
MGIMKNNRTGTDPVVRGPRRNLIEVLHENEHDPIPAAPAPQILTEVPPIANIEPIIEVKNIR